LVLRRYSRAVAACSSRRRNERDDRRNDSA
jgi:hypothetical protein